MLNSIRSLYHRSLLGGAAAFALAGIISLRLSHAGGWSLVVGPPRADDDPRFSEYALIVRAGGCGGPGSTVSASAEGILDGKRVSRPLELTRLSTDQTPVFGLHRSWPTEGKWALAFQAKRTVPVYKDGIPTGETFRPTLHVLVPLGADGVPMTRATPGGKYPYFLKSYYVAGENREKQIRQLLQPATVTTARSK